jgi:hypothetical protein
LADRDSAIFIASERRRAMLDGLASLKGFVDVRVFLAPTE